MIYFISRLIYKAILKIFFGFEVKGRENFPKKGPFILASNHVSFADPVVMGVACNTAPVAFIAKKELFDTSILGRWIKAVGCIPIERNSLSFKPLKEAVRRLKQSGVIGIFPEGTRSLDGRLQKAEPGIGLIARKSGAPIIPMYISGTEKALPRGKTSLRIHKIKATIGKPVDITESTAFPEKIKIYDSIGEKVMSAIAGLKDE